MFQFLFFFNGTKNTFFPHLNGLLCTHPTLETTALEYQQCFQSGFIIWLEKLVITQFCNCQHFFIVPENANLTLQIRLLLNYAITCSSILWMNQTTMKQCLNKLFILLMMLRPRKLLHLMANISESIFHFFTITVFFKCVISLKLHLHVKFKKKKLLFFFPVIKNSQHNEADRIFIGRSGISVMYSYHKALQWIKVYWTIET